MAERLVTAEWLGDLVARIFRALDVPDDDAAIIADHMVHAELRDVRSHGVSRVRVYAERLQAGLVHPCARLRVLRETPVSVHLDGGNGPGPVVAQRAMDRVIEKAREVGIGVGAVRGSNHCGMLAHYTTRALAHGLIGVATTSAPANMPLWGGRERYLGTNPLSYAIPTGAEIDIVFDMATSWVARGKILIAAAADKPIPLGWAVDPAGHPTTDPHAALAGTVLPLGGPKGSGLAFFVEVMSSVLSGAAIGPQIGPLYDNPDRPQDVGHFFFAMRVDLFAEPAEFARRMDDMIAEIRALVPATGHERIQLPGEIEMEHAARRRRDGIPLADAVYDDLAALARDLAVAV